ncbi:MAG: acyl-[acyl-carrier-protein]--UDP-N-acetylglucosamine O-acyltransferase [Candidatus Rokuibacteriota bacterium]|nr:MAG: acyl-[acyl-carrier-protein]--UDP-N-acetylglucosamine O-acyltransferase [Candidatus Rokubacteria bacterium]
MTAPDGPHPTAVVDPRAQLGTGARVGAYSIIGPEVALGDGVEVGHHVVLEGRVMVGAGSRIGHGSVVGSPPQDLKFKDGTPSGVRIGEGTTLREYVTVHRATQPGTWTTIGRGCLLMSMSHVAHDCRLGDGVIVINYAGITGHCEIDEGATVGGLTGVHPFCRIGAYAYVGGCSKITADVPPYTIVDGAPATARGINVLGLRRSGVGAEDRQLLRVAFRMLYRSGLAPRGALDRIRDELPATPHIVRLVQFIEASKRGICGPPRTGEDVRDDAPDDQGERVF